MNGSSIKLAIEETLKNFSGRSLGEAALDLFETLGYRSEKRFALQPNTTTTFQEIFDQDHRLNPKQALLDQWQFVDPLFQLTDEEIREAAGGNQLSIFDSKGPWNGAIIQSYLFFAITLRQADYTRTQLAGITRAVNRLFPMPVMLLFGHGDMLTLAIINRRLHKRDASRDVLEKVTLIKDIRFTRPHRAHIEILFELCLKELFTRYAFKNFVELHQAWQKTLDTSILNKRFYQELANWYFWALDHVSFPKEAPKDRDGRDSVSLIRLITRLIFCWFLKEKGLIPDALFQESRVRALLESLEKDENSYYTSILQNLFFATLNTEMDQPGKPITRRFLGENKDNRDSDDHMIHQVWRHAERIRDRTEFERLLRGIPFLNGGLFECLDERIEKGASNYTREIRVDGFSVKPSKQPKVPNFVFFGSEKIVDLSGAYGEGRYRQTRIQPLIPLLERYKFTVAENTPIEEEVALDPELLGHVFENLLAAYNPETDTTARKTTGSFYTPRVVVDFMVDEALIAYLENRLQRTFSNRSDFEPRLRQLLAYTAADPEFSSDEVTILVDAIDQIKILDPACGSGAFPMGALQKLVFLLSRLDPGNGGWKERQLTKARRLDVGRDAALQAVEEAFARDQGDYGRKLYLIENCLYGVDIQPIAVQIAKLRCFISLVVEQKPDDMLPNRGILPLPNLETNFIAANTLFRLHRRKQLTLIADDIEAKQDELCGVRHEYFLARRYRDKKKFRKLDKALLAELAELLEANQLFSGPEAEVIANWDPYHVDRSAPFFDPDWMFNLGAVTAARHRRTGQGNEAARSFAGFDIVIGNPPYVRQEELKRIKAFKGLSGLERPLKEALKADYFCYTGVADLYVYFYERGLDLLALDGVLCFISSNKYFRAAYGERLRHFLTANGEVLLLIDFGDAPVFTAIAYPSIVLVRKTRETRDKDTIPLVPKDLEKWLALVPAKAEVLMLRWESGPPVETFPDIVAQRSFKLPQRELKPDGWRLESPVKLQLLEKLRRAGKPLGDYVNGRFYRGILTGLNAAFVVDRVTRDRLTAEHESSAEVLKPFLRGRDVKRWRLDSQDLWLIFTRRGIDISKYPAIYGHLNQFKERLAPGLPGGRKPGKYQWWEIQDNVAYWQEFKRPKIVYPDIYEHQSFVWDEEGFYTANTCYFIPTEEKWLTGLLNSLVVEWFYGMISSRVRGGYLRAFSDYMRWIPIPRSPQSIKRSIETIVSKIQTAKKQSPDAFVSELEAEIDGMVAHLYTLTEKEYRLLLEDLPLSDPVRIAALNAYRETELNFAT